MAGPANERAHALLSASGSKIWLTCTPSAVLQSEFPDTAGFAAQEGTHAHLLAETLFLDFIEKDPWLDFKLAEIKSHPTLYKPEMSGYIDEYVTEVLSNVYENSQLFAEQKFDFSKWVPGGFGTGDVTIITPGMNFRDMSFMQGIEISDDMSYGDFIDVWDLKYGQGVEVSAINNSQLRLYGLGAVVQHSKYDFKWIRLNIYQPRKNNYSSEIISVVELLKYANTYIKPRAIMAEKGEGDFVPGDHCKFCKANGSCRALTEYNQKLAEKEFTNPHLLTDTEILHLYNNMPIFDLWRKAVKDYVLARALGGKKWEGLKLVEGRANRKYIDPVALGEKLAMFFGDEIYEPQTLHGITALKGVIGTANFIEYVEPELFQPRGKPSLASVESEKPEFDVAGAVFDGPVIDEDYDI